MNNMRFDKEYLTRVLKRHGYDPVIVDNLWLSFALQILILEKLNKR